MTKRSQLSGMVWWDGYGVAKDGLGRLEALICQNEAKLCGDRAEAKFSAAVLLESSAHRLICAG